jgi:cytoplasmic iron level regulating protein YaaA (DUF328/UPF0246 family)
MARRRLILIPPSEGKALGGEGPVWDEIAGTQDHPLYSNRRAVIGAIGDMIASKPGDRALAKFFGVGGAALARSIDADSSLAAAQTLPAIERYDGVLYQHLDAASMTSGQRRRLRRDVRIVSGMWGVVDPDEAIPDYRLKMSAHLDPLGKLSTWWRPSVTTLLTGQAVGAEVWNLLPGEHAAAVASLGVRMVTRAVFLSPNRVGELTAVSHWNKALKGALVSHLLRNPSMEVAHLTDWDHPAGYRLDPASLRTVRGVRELRFVATD